MELQALYDLQERLEATAAAGVRLAGEDFPDGKSSHKSEYKEFPRVLLLIIGRNNYGTSGII
ncbi:hypothetical protein DFR60_102325 [Hungatella effluvii]|uniref:Uncharacterized protein n=1 Tax=Hungatella effluvii TaxID=1096246 RepID=A0A2V3YFA5_9FIRM|nr:hypothetical protein [Hungatella effluvii]PXX56050.1 hypothetical protein DFR60_102325 [Hungatella effluvii]